MLCKTRTLEDGITEINACLLDTEMREMRSYLVGSLDKEIGRNFVIYNVK